MVFLVLWTKVASALEGLRSVKLVQLIRMDVPTKKKFANTLFDIVSTDLLGPQRAGSIVRNTIEILCY